MEDMIILTDTRQQKEKHIIKEFDKEKILHIQTKLDTADYMAIRYNNGFYKDFTTLIDTKKDLQEVCGNLCNTSEHQRVVNEIEKAKQLGCKNFIFLVGGKIKNAEDIKKWKSKHTRINGEILLKVMKTFSEHHGVKFIFVEKTKMGKKVIELLKKN